MRVRKFVVVAALGLVSLTGCSNLIVPATPLSGLNVPAAPAPGTPGAASPSTTSTPGAAAPGAPAVVTALTSAQAVAVIPTKAQVGSQWVAGEITDDAPSDPSTPTTAPAKVSPAKCSALAGGGIKDIQLAQKATPAISKTLSFTKSGAAATQVDTIAVNISSYPVDIDVSRIAQSIALIKSCSSYTSTAASGATTKWTLSILPIPAYQDGTLAFRLKGSTGSVVISIDLVQIISANNVVSVAQTALGTSDKSDRAVIPRVAKAIASNLKKVTKS